MKLMTVNLPAGDVPGFDVAMSGWTGGGRANYNPIADGFDGIRFVGKGRGLTRIRPTDNPGGWTIHAGLQCGTVWLEGLTVECDTFAKGGAIHAGSVKKYNPSLYEKNRIVMRDFSIEAPPRNPVVGYGRAWWGLFSINYDIDLEDGDIEVGEALEHGAYEHGYARYGSRWKKVNVLASGGEGSKAATRPEEAHFAPEAQIIRKDCRFREWYQPHANRGGAGVVLQGTGAQSIQIDRCGFWGGEGLRSRCLMIDDGGGVRTHEDGTLEPRFYDTSGTPGGTGAANGNIQIRRSGMHGVGQEHWTSIVKVDSIAAGDILHTVAEGVAVRECGIFGQRTFLGIDGVPEDRVSVKRCNTPALKRFAESEGMNTEHETRLKYAKKPIVLVSEGR